MHGGLIRNVIASNDTAVYILDDELERCSTEEIYSIIFYPSNLQDYHLTQRMVNASSRVDALALEIERQIDEKDTVKCDSCGDTFRLSQIKIKLPDIPNLGKRLDPKGIVPFGECPDEDCKALVYLD